MNKSQIRVQLLKRREQLLPRVKSAKDKKIIDRLLKFPLFRASTEFFTYLSHRGEFSTDQLIQKFFAKKKIIVAKIRNRVICLYELKHPGEFEKGKFGIREPKFCLPKRVWSEIDVALIPAVAFDHIGHRIGFGGGYFDRLLKKLRCVTIGLAYEFQIIDKVPTHVYDVPVDYIITERRLINCCALRAHSLLSTRFARASCQLFRNRIRKSTKSSRPK